MVKNNAGGNLQKKTEEYSVKERIFLTYMGLTAVLTILTIISNLIIGVDFSFNYKWLLILLFTSVHFILALKRFKPAVIHRTGIYTIIFVIAPVSWMSSAGLDSPSISYFILNIILLNYMFHNCERIFLNIMSVLITLGLIAVYGVHPEMFKTLTHQEKISDWLINVPVTFTFIIILLVMFERAYESERLSNERKSIELEQLANTDFLTGLNNRVNLNDKMVFLKNTYNRTGRPYSIIIIDIDYFKAYNDTHGHIEGDKCLKNFALLLKNRITRSTDWVYRYGGEEFLILLGFTSSGEAMIVAEKIREDLKLAAIPHGASDLSPNLTVSMGISTVKHIKQNPEEVLEQADIALYRSKKRGRNRICHFHDN